MNTDSLRASLDKLVAAGWEVKLYDAPQAVPLPLANRYADVPDDYRLFLSWVKTCASPRGTDWFLTLPEFAGEADNRFAWNEWERQSIASFEGNVEWEQATRTFWDTHLPVFLSAGMYSYVAYDLTSPRRELVGAINLHWEEPRPRAESFTAFVADLAAEKRPGPPPVKCRKLSPSEKQLLQELFAGTLIAPEETGDVKLTVRFLELMRESGVLPDRYELIDGVIIKKEPRITLGDYRRFLAEYP
ncbi:MAG: hypothetical protein H7Y38_10135 [Armatimonadetes bacterium]|nr:hypothetical protein [Armatimonadota bacterium]